MSFLVWYRLVCWLIRIGMIPVIIRKRYPPSTALAWLAFIFLIPPLGLLLYMLIGGEVLGRKRRRLHRRVIERKRPHYPSEVMLNPVQRDRQAPVVAQTERDFGMQRTEGNHVDLLGEHGRFIRNMILDINEAKNHVHMIFYIFEPDETGKEIAAALMAAARRGVNVRVLADAAGSRALFKRDGLAEHMRRDGVHIHPALPASILRLPFARLDLRNHRKLLIVDGKSAFTGSHNICNPTYDPAGEFKTIDLSVRLTGPVVAQMQVVFAEDWAFETEEDLDPADLFPETEHTGTTRIQTVPSGPDHESQTFHSVLLGTINSARERLVLTTPYFIPDQPTMLALSLAAARGVNVHVIVSERTDYAIVTAAGRSYFERLLDYGIKVSLYRPALLHAKTLTIDDSFALIGSSNIDIRSFLLNFELNLLLYGEEITGQLHEVQQAFMKDSTPLDLLSWRSRPLLNQFADDSAALLSPLL